MTNDPWSSPHAPEHAGTRGPGLLGLRGKPRPKAVFTHRVKTVSYACDRLVNRTSTDDDLHGFWDRTLGTESHDGANGKPYQLTGAQQPTGCYAGPLTAACDVICICLTFVATLAAAYRRRAAWVNAREGRCLKSAKGAPQVLRCLLFWRYSVVGTAKMYIRFGQVWVAVGCSRSSGSGRDNQPMNVFLI